MVVGVVDHLLNPPVTHLVKLLLVEQTLEVFDVDVGLALLILRALDRILGHVVRVGPDGADDAVLAEGVLAVEQGVRK